MLNPFTLVRRSAVVVMACTLLTNFPAMADVSPISRYIESFEANQLPSGWYKPAAASAGWNVVNCPCADGSYSLRSDQVTDRRDAIIEYVNHFKAGVLNFDYHYLRDAGQVGSRSWLSVTVDGIEVSVANSEVTQWQRFQIEIPEGLHTVRWTYHERGILARNENQVSIDNIRYLPGDQDNDGMADQWEYLNGLNYDNAQDAALDNDNDRLSNKHEYLLQSNPNKADTDGDQLNDGDEVSPSSDLSTDINSVDTDHDEFDDGWEVSHNFDPLNPNDHETDTDGDGLTDFQEYKLQTSPLDALDQPAYITRQTESFGSSVLPQGWSKPWAWHLGVRDETKTWLKTIDTADNASLTATANWATVEWAGDFDEGVFSFDYKVAGSRSHIALYIDGAYQGLFDSEQWQRKQFEVSRGVHIFTLRFALSNGVAGTGWIDNVEFIGVSADSDADGLPDAWEIQQGLDSFDAADAHLDNDNDGLTNLEEYQAGSNAFAADSDNDGLNDIEEIALGTDPANNDSDNDGIPDGWEVANQTDPLAVSGALDSDNDGFTDLDEYLSGSVANDATSMPTVIDQLAVSFESGELPGAGVWKVPTQVTIPPEHDLQSSWTGSVTSDWQVSDGKASDGQYGLGSVAVQTSNDPDVQAIEWSAWFAGGELTFDWFTTDTNGDFIFLIDGQRRYLGSVVTGQWQQSAFTLSKGQHRFTWIQLNYADQSPLSASWIDNLVINRDSDQDGLPDFWEVKMGLDRNDAGDATLDSDNDGLNNLEEYAAGTQVGQSDTDGDGLSDSDEVRLHQSNPLKADSDGDSLPDNWELAHGYDPLLANDIAADTDVDGFTDRVEYLLSTDPRDSASLPLLTTQLAESFEGGALSLPFVTPAGAANWNVLKREVIASDGEHLLRCDGYFDGRCEVQWTAYLAAGAVFFDSAWRLSNMQLSVNGEPIQWQYDFNGYTTVPVEIAAPGVYTFDWVYDGSGQQFDDPGYAHLDNIRFFAANSDSDRDGIPDQWEYRQGLNWQADDNSAIDTDNDGLTDLLEYQLGSDVNNADSDNDGLSDGTEVNEHQTNPLSSDSDGDGLADQWEVGHQFNPLNSTDAAADNDSDGFSNLQEVLSGTNPLDADEQPLLLNSYVASFETTEPLPQGWSVGLASDVQWRSSWSHADQMYSLYNGNLAEGDQAVLLWAGNFADGELQFNWQADIGASALYIDEQLIEWPLDDNQRRTFTLQLSAGFHLIKWLVNDLPGELVRPRLSLSELTFFAQGSDSDADGIADKWEYQHGLNFNDAADALLDSDNDGANNLAEYLAGTSMASADSDHDGLPDGWEIEFGLDPLNPAAPNSDTDGDGFSDLVEYQQGSAPADNTSMPLVIADYIESFEGDVLPTAWLVDGDGWQLSSEHSADGQQSLSSGILTDNQTTAIEFKGFFAAGELSFWLKTSSERYFDQLHFYLDGVLQTRHSGDLAWQDIAVSLTAGAHTLRWVYSKDAGTSENSDRVWLDNLVFFGHGLDSDGDGLPDLWEYNQGLDRFNRADADADSDNDGLTNREEYLAGTNPQSSDSDNDGLVDSVEIAAGLDPLNSADRNADTDGDGFSNIEELNGGSDPTVAASVPGQIAPWLRLLLNKTSADKK